MTVFGVLFLRLTDDFSFAFVLVLAFGFAFNEAAVADICCLSFESISCRKR